MGPRWPWSVPVSLDRRCTRVDEARPDVVFESGRMGGRLRSQRFGAADDVFAELGGMLPRSSTTFFHYVDLLGPYETVSEPVDTGGAQT